MKQLYIIPLLLLLLGSCQKDTDYIIQTNQMGVVLRGPLGSTATFEVSASGTWSLESSDSEYTCKPLSGDAGVTKVTVTRTKNVELTKLGRITLRTSNKEIEIEVQQAPCIAPQTILFYLAGRGNLTGAFERNIVNALKALESGTAGDSRIMVFRQTGTSISEVSELAYNPYTKKAEQYILKSYNEPLSSVDQATMTRILNDMIALAPANEYGMIMGSHATAWVPAIYPTITSTEGGFLDPYWLKASGADLTRSFGFDNGRAMDISSLAAGIEATGKKFNYIIFDACFMSSIETLYDLRNTAKFIIGSPCEIMMYGIPYDLALPHLLTKKGLEYDLIAFCRAFYDFYTNTNLTRKSGCIAMTHTSDLEALAEIMQRINTKGLKSYNPEDIQIYEGLTPHLFYDMSNYVSAACKDAGLLEEFNAMFERAFAHECRLHTPIFYTAFTAEEIPINSYSGVSISEPSTKYTAENRQTDWYIATH